MYASRSQAMSISKLPFGFPLTKIRCVLMILDYSRYFVIHTPMMILRTRSEESNRASSTQNAMLSFLSFISYDSSMTKTVNRSLMDELKPNQAAKAAAR